MNVWRVGTAGRRHGCEWRARAKVVVVAGAVDHACFTRSSLDVRMRRRMCRGRWKCRRGSVLMDRSRVVFSTSVVVGLQNCARGEAPTPSPRSKSRENDPCQVMDGTVLLELECNGENHGSWKATIAWTHSLIRTSNRSTLMTAATRRITSSIMMNPDRSNNDSMNRTNSRSARYLMYLASLLPQHQRHRCRNKWDDTGR